MPVSCSGGGNTVTITFSLRPVSSSQGKEDVSTSAATRRRALIGVETHKAWSRLRYRTLLAASAMNPETHRDGTGIARGQTP